MRGVRSQLRSVSTEVACDRWFVTSVHEVSSFFQKRLARSGRELNPAGVFHVNRTRFNMVSNNNELAYNSKVEGEVVVSRADAVINWIRTNSIWPMPMGLACCAIELMAVGNGAVRHLAFWRGGDAVFSPAVGLHDRRGHASLTRWLRRFVAFTTR